MAKVAIQGGVKNYLPSREVTVPVEAKSSKNHVKAHLAYITDKEQKLLLEKNLHGSLKGKPNRGPGGLPSLQGDFGPGGNNPGGFSSNQGGPGGTGNTGDSGGIGSGEESAFRDSGTGRYNLSKDPKDQQAVNDYVQGKMGYQAGKKPSFFGNPFQSLAVRNNIYQRRANVNLAQKRAFQKYQDIEKYADIMDEYGLTAEELADKVAKDPSYGYDFSDLDPGKKTLGSNIGTSLEKYRQNLYDVNPKTSYSMIQSILNKTRPDTQVTAQNTLNKARAYNKAVNAVDIRGEINRLGNLGNSNLTGQFTGGDGDGQKPFIPINYNTGAATTEAVEPYTNDFTYRFGDDQNVIYDQYGDPGYRTTAAEGGIMGTRARRAMGGIMNRVDQRQQFFLGGIGKAIKGVVGGVVDATKKVLKSDVGKIALAGAAFMYGPKLFGAESLGGFGGYGELVPKIAKNKFLSGALLNSDGDGFNPFKVAGILGIGGAALMGPAKQDPSIIGDRGGRLKDSQGNDALPADIRAEIKEAYASGDSDRINAIQDYYAFLPPTNQYLPYPNYAQGGRIGKAEGGLMDLGGMEKDYRAEGGFVPIGEYEKKDDVPARLSVNEFVFTADAVRGAGQGDIDKGAEIMENMMENLENGGTVSEESQGNKGAQNMFKTSERLGAVI